MTKYQNNKTTRITLFTVFVVGSGWDRLLYEEERGVRGVQQRRDGHRLPEPVRKPSTHAGNQLKPLKWLKSKRKMFY